MIDDGLIKMVNVGIGFLEFLLFMHPMELTLPIHSFLSKIDCTIGWLAKELRLYVHDIETNLWCYVRLSCCGAIDIALTNNAYATLISSAT